MAIRIYDQTVGQLAGIVVTTTGLGAIKRDGTEAYAQLVSYVNGAGTASDLMLDSTGQDILTELQTPAASLPPPVPVASSALLSTFTNVSVDVTSATTTPLISATASQVGRIHKGFLVIGTGAQTVQFKSASTNLTGAMSFSTGGVIILNDDIYPELKTATNEALNMVTTTAVSVAGWIQYVKGAPS